MKSSQNTNEPKSKQVYKVCAGAPLADDKTERSTLNFRWNWWLFCRWRWSSSGWRSSCPCWSSRNLSAVWKCCWPAPGGTRLSEDNRPGPPKPMRERGESCFWCFYLVLLKLIIMRKMPGKIARRYSKCDLYFSLYGIFLRFRNRETWNLFVSRFFRTFDCVMGLSWR